MTDKETMPCEFLTHVAPALAATRKPDVTRKIGGFQQIIAPSDTRSLQGIGMPDNLKTELAKIDQQPQRQDAALDQLKDLQAFANKLGLYDAADLIGLLTTKK